MKIFENIDDDINKKLFSETIEECENLKGLDSLFECNETFKNHFYFENLSDDSFFDVSGAKDEFVKFYRKITKSGVGTIILGGINLWVNSKENNNQARITLDKNILPEYKRLVSFAHSAKANVFLKVDSGLGRFYTYQTYNKGLKLGSNFCFDPKNKQKLVFRISDNKCNELINEMMRILMLSNIVGFDGIMIDASFGNVIGELSSQEFNKRFFGYFSNTDDFLKKVLKNIDTANNKVILKISLLSFFSKEKNDVYLCKIKPEINEEKILLDLKTYTSLGVDGFEFVFGRWENEFLSNFNGFEGEYLFSEIIRKIRKYFNKNQITNKFGKEIEIFYHDNFSSFSKANDLIKNNIINFIDVTKNIYSDLNFLKQTKNANLVRNCLKCSHCNKIAEKNKNIECLINPELNNFEENILTTKANDIAVVGSGISGLICSLTLAKRGYNIYIFDKQNTLNYNGKLSTIFGFDKCLANFYNTIEKEINEFVKKKKITLCLNQEFFVNQENLNKYYSIIVATGFKQIFLPISGAVQPHVISLYDALQKEKLLLSKKHIVIYAKSILSLKLALFLSDKNKMITLIIKDMKLFNLNKNANLFYLFHILYKFNSKILFYSRVTQINEDNIDVLISKHLHPNSVKTMLDIFSNAKLNLEKRLINLDCDLFIYEPDITPNNALYTQIVNEKYKGEVYLIGNALENTTLAENIKSGYFVGKNL